MATETEIADPAEKSAASPAEASPNLKPGRSFPEAFDELDELEAGKPPKETAPKPAPKPKADKVAPPKPEPKPPGTAPKPAEKAEDESAPKPEVKKGAEPKEDEAEPGESDPSAKFQLAHDLRKEYRKLHKTVQDKDRELSTLKAKLNGAPVNNAILDENKSLKKRLEEVETELRYVDYTKSSEFKEKFERPYQDAYADAVEEVKELRVTLPDGNSRPATAQDLDRILQADSQDVRAVATELFGEAAPDVLAARRRLVELNRNANRESKRYREQAAERERQKAVKLAEEKEGMERLWNKAVADIKEKYSEYFGHIEGDDEYNAELDKGYATVDRAHAPNLPIEEKVSRLAALRHRAAAFRAQVLINRRQKARITELEEVVAGYEKSAPSGGRGASEGERVEGEENGYKSAAEELDALGRLDATE